MTGDHARTADGRYAERRRRGEEFTATATAARIVEDWAEQHQPRLVGWVRDLFAPRAAA